MPLTKSGARILKGFVSQYGKKGKGFFYATIKKNPRQTKNWHITR